FLSGHLDLVIWIWSSGPRERPGLVNPAPIMACASMHPGAIRVSLMRLGAGAHTGAPYHVAKMTAEMGWHAERHSIVFHTPSRARRANTPSPGLSRARTPRYRLSGAVGARFVRVRGFLSPLS